MELLENLTGYSKKQIDFVFAMLETGNISKSCKMASISEATAFKYLKNRTKWRNKQDKKKSYRGKFEETWIRFHKSDWSYNRYFRR